MRDFRSVFRASIAALLVASCERGAQDDGAARVTENAVTFPRLPVAEPPLDRAAILLAVGQAASSSGLGLNDAAQQRRLDGKRFEFRIRFGCEGSAELQPGQRFSVAFDAAERTLRLRATPDLTIKDPRVAPFADETVEAVEGFWVRRPWLLAAKCPRVAGTAPQPVEAVTTETNVTGVAAEEAKATEPRFGPLSPASPAPKVGIAQFFTKTDARTGRRDSRAYETTQVLDEDDKPSDEGYNLVLSGRFRRLPGGRVIACRLTNPDVPPDCILSVLFDRVWIERPETKAIVAEWSKAL